MSAAAPTTDPRELLKSRQYLVLLAFGAVVGVVVAFVAYYFLKFISNSQTWVFQTLPGDLGFSSEPTWWPIPVAGRRRRSGGARDHPATRHRRTLPGGRLQGRRADPADLAAGHHPGGVLHARLGRRARPRGAADRHRRRHRRVDVAGGQTRRSRSGRDAGRCGGKLRCDCGALRRPAAGTVSADGGGRRRRANARRDPGARPPGCGPWRADLRRPRQSDRLRHVLARGTQHPADRHAHRRRASVGRGHRRSGGDSGQHHQAFCAGVSVGRATAHGAADAGRRARSSDCWP